MKLGKSNKHLHFRKRIDVFNTSSRTTSIELIGVLLLVMCLPLQATSKVNPQHAAKFYSEALTLKPDLENGRKLYKYCVACHGPEAWGTKNGTYPQIAGQLKEVIIKQMDDIRAGNRDNPIMRAFTSQRVLKGPQEIADVAGYIANLPMNPDNGRGRLKDEEVGKDIYARECAECHGDNGEGDAEEIIPLIQGQHYWYLIRQFDWIRNGRRRNADIEMVKQIRRFSLTDETAVIAYTASLMPDKEKLADPDWKNPDFAGYKRDWRDEIKKIKAR